MASYADKTSTSSAEEPVTKLTKGTGVKAPSDTGYALDEKRRAALSEIDSAKFS